MKQVFNNRQLAHVWAQQTQSTGRNPSGSMYFSNNKIWSYGSHYCIASINVNSKGEKLNLVNEHNYGNTTCKQRNNVWDALNYKGLYVPCPADINNPKNEAYLFDQLIETIENCLNPRKMHYHHESYKGALANLNQFLSFIGKDQVVVPMALIEIMIDVHCVRVIQKRERDLKNEEKYRIESFKREQDRKARIEEYKQELELWPKGLNTKSIPSDLFPKDYDMVRIKTNNPEVVETCRGAEVPLSHALRLLDLTLKRQVKQGEKVGHFKVDNVNETSDLLTIGCHTISVKQASEVLLPLLGKVS